MNKSVKRGIFYFTLVFAMAFTVLFVTEKLSNVVVESNSHLRMVELLAAQKVEKIWNEGDSRNLWKDGKIKCNPFLGNPSETDSEFTRCNPNFIDCLFSNNTKIPISYKKRSYELTLEKNENGTFHRLITRSKSKEPQIPSYGIEVRIKFLIDNSQISSLPIILEDTCHESVLPERIYAVGPDIFKGEDRDFRFDTFGRKILVDRHLVTIRDLVEWYEEIKKPHTFELSEYQKPALHLTALEMSDFCAFHGKQLMSAEIFDAATFYPSDVTDPRPIRNMRGPYPWGRKQTDSFLYKAKTEENFVFEPVYCEKVYTKECIALVPYKNYSNSSPSWIGLFEALGGYPEYMRNPIDPLKSVKVSSIYFSTKSEWHQLGVRAYWNGEGRVSDKDFDWQGMEEPEAHSIAVGFRCMRFL